MEGLHVCVKNSFIFEACSLNRSNSDWVKDNKAGGTLLQVVPLIKRLSILDWHEGLQHVKANPLGPHKLQLLMNSYVLGAQVLS